MRAGLYNQAYWGLEANIKPLRSPRATKGRRSGLASFVNFVSFVVHLNFGRVVAAKFIRFSLSPGVECAAQQRSRELGVLIPGDKDDEHPAVFR